MNAHTAPHVATPPPPHHVAVAGAAGALALGAAKVLRSLAPEAWLAAQENSAGILGSGRSVPTAGGRRRSALREWRLVAEGGAIARQPTPGSSGVSGWTGAVGV